MRTHHLALLGAALLTGSLTLACGGDDGDPQARTQSIDSTSGDESSGTTAAGSTDDGDETATDEGAASDGSSGGEVIGTTRAQLTAGPIDERTIPVRVDVTRLERHGDLVELTLQLTNEAPAEGDDPPGFAINTLFGADYDASGIGLVDGGAQKLYLPVLDSDESCLCTSDFGANDVPAGGSRTITATYGGVPDDVDALDLQVPSFPTVSGVPIQ
jgi:hypothetical protein